VAEVISTWTRIPAQKIFKDEAASLMSMEHRMSKRVFGQPEAISNVCRAVRRARVGVNDPNRPLGVFLFIGPTGVGKTETVKALADEIFEDENRMVRIDMSEYMEQHNISRLIGSPPGYIGHGEGGELTEAVRRTPYTVVLFDEIEKAHPRVLDLLLQTFDDGRLTDGNGRLIDFKNTLMVMTSNIPLDLKSSFGSKGFDEEVRGQLAKALRPEFVGRIDEVILFKRLGSNQIEQLLDKKTLELNYRLSGKQFRIVLGENLRKELLSMSTGGQFGGRALRRIFQTTVVDQVTERFLRFPDLCKGVWQLEKRKDGLYSWNEDFSLHRYLKAAP
jgi:ATP-dependent Clp protease ATP-binding subunit ClpA